jgi:hypothetical protein
VRLPESLTQSIEPAVLDDLSNAQLLEVESSAREAASELRHRIAVLVALIALTPVALVLVELPQRTINLNLLGSALSIRLSTDSLLLTLLPVLVCAGVDWALRGHPDVQAGEVPYLFPYWIAPGLAALAMANLLTRISAWGPWIGVLLLGIFIITILIAAEYVSLSPNASGYAVARLALTGVSYVIAFALFTLIYSTRERSAVTATITFFVAAFLSLDLLAPHIIGLGRAGLYAFVIGLVVAETTWALNYWNVSNWSGGVLLMTVFYVLSGLAQQHFQDKLNRFVLIEFAVTAAVALVVVWQLAEIR